MTPDNVIAMSAADLPVNSGGYEVPVDEALYASAAALAEAHGESVDEVVARALRAALAEANVSPETR
jgi:hypothetical protein